MPGYLRPTIACYTLQLSSPQKTDCGRDGGGTHSLMRVSNKPIDWSVKLAQAAILTAQSETRQRTFLVMHAREFWVIL